MDWMATAANASLISIRSRSATVSPALSSARSMAPDGWDCSELSGPATTPCAPTSASTGAPAAAAASADITTTAQAPSEICDADPAVIVPSSRERGAKPAQRLRRGVGADALVGVEDHRLAAPLRHGHGDDLLGQQPVLDRLGRALVRPGRELVLLLAADAQPGVVPLGGLAHRHVVERVGQAVVRHRVDELGRAELEAAARPGQQVRRLGHRLHAAGHHDVELPGPDQLRGQRDRVQPGQADLVDRERRAPSSGCPPATAACRDGIWPAPGLQHLAHDHVVDPVARHAGALQRRLDHDAAELRPAEAAQRAEQAPDGRSGPADDHRISHT